MDFGKLPYQTLDSVDFSLPPEPAGNDTVLKGTRISSPLLHVGCPRWAVKEWVGKIYPKGTKDANFLDEYAKQFNCIELNSTFYNLYNEASIAKWAFKVPSGFKFCPKVYQGISHEGSLDDKQELLHVFQKSMAAFGEQLGPAFLQFSDGFGPQRSIELFSFLEEVPAEMNLFIELRHPGWYQPNASRQLADALRQLNKGWVITDTAGRRDVCHMHLTQPKAFIRFVANNLHRTDYTRIDSWAERIGDWVNRGLEELYFIIHMEGEMHSPELAGYLIDRLNERCGLALKRPIVIQPELF